MQRRGGREAKPPLLVSIPLYVHHFLSRLPNLSSLRIVLYVVHRPCTYCRRRGYVEGGRSRQRTARSKSRDKNKKTKEDKKKKRSHIARKPE